MNRLGRSESLKLFSWHAFLRPSPIPGYEELSKRIAEACKGHPLSLEVIGAFLYDKQDENVIDCWNETLYNIAVHRDIFERLKISYSGLNAEEKEIFLDIACFFIGERTTSPIVFWKSMYTMVHTAITNLSMKSLIKIDEKCAFDMHDLVRDMGRIIAKEKHTRQWETAQSSGSFNSSSNLNISRLRLYKGDSQYLRILCRSNLRYLHLEQVHIEDIIDSLPPSLIWLKVDSCSFPITKHSSKLFDLNIAMKKKSTSVSGIRSELRIMELTNCRPLRILPDTISHLPLLQSLNLSGSHKLDCAPDTISNLSQLLYLNLSYCEKLRYLPDSIGNLSHLQYLNLTCCKVLIKLPNSIDKLSQLKHLSLSWCKKLQSLPEGISNLSKLERLDMLNCYSAWKSIPYDILIRPKLCLLGLLPLVEEWRRGELRERRLMKSEDQTQDWTTPECRESMAKFRATLSLECQKLELKLTKIRLFPGKSFFRNKSKLELKLPVATEFTRCLLLPSAFLYRAPPCSGYRAHSVSFGYRVVSLHLPRSLEKLDSCRQRFRCNMSSCPIFSAKAQRMVTRNITSCSAEKESETKSITSIITKETSDIIKTATPSFSRSAPSSSRSAPNLSMTSTSSFSTSLSGI